MRLAIRCGVPRLIICRAHQSRCSHFLGGGGAAAAVAADAALVRPSPIELCLTTTTTNERRRRDGSSRVRKRITESSGSRHSAAAVRRTRSHSLTNARTQRPLFSPVVISGDEGDAHLSLMFEAVQSIIAAHSPTPTSHCCLTFTTDSFVRSVARSFVPSSSSLAPNSSSFAVLLPFPPSLLPPSPFQLPPPLSLLAETKRGAYERVSGGGGGGGNVGAGGGG